MKNICGCIKKSRKEKTFIAVGQEIQKLDFIKIPISFTSGKFKDASILNNQKSQIGTSEGIFWIYQLPYSVYLY